MQLRVGYAAPCGSVGARLCKVVRGVRNVRSVECVCCVRAGVCPCD